MGVTLLSFVLTAFASASDKVPAADSTRPAELSTATKERPHMWMTIGGKERFAVTLENNATARAFVQLLPATLDMPDLNGNEKHVALSRSLPSNPVRAGTIRMGDVMLYGSNTLVVFYKTFPSSYSYTRIGRVRDTSGLAEALGAGDQRISFAMP